MLPILLCMLTTTQSFNVNISTLYPSFESYDNMPYMDIEVKNSSSLFLYFSEFETLKIYHNTMLVYILNQSSTINLTLVPGLNELHIMETNVTKIMIAYQIYPLTWLYVNINGVECPSNQTCNSTSDSIMFSGGSIQTYYIAFSLDSRSFYKAQAFGFSYTPPGMNFLLATDNGAVAMFKVYRVESNEVLKSFSFETPEIKLYPRFQSTGQQYLIVPKLSFNQNTLAIRASTVSSNCTIRFDSEKGSFMRQTVNPGSLAVISLNGQDDRIFLSTMCKLFSNTYIFSVGFKSRLKYLSHFMVFIGEPDSPVARYSDVYTMTLTPLSFKNYFTTTSFLNELNHFDYQPALTLNLRPESEKAVIFVEGLEYLKNYVMFSPKIGSNTLNITVFAEDSVFSQDYYLEFYMRNNDSSLKTLEVPLIQPLLDKTNAVYRSFIEFSSTFIPIKLSSTDPKSLITIEYENHTFSSNSSIETSVPFTSLTLFLSATVQAESQSLSSVYNITFIRLDLCGNGLRFSINEECDDGNLVTGDGCSKDCKIETGWECSGGTSTLKDSCSRIPEPEGPSPICGNNKKELGEECDDSNDIQCINCQLLPSICGNGVKEKGEECDDGNSANNDGCSNCKIDSNGAICGDGLRTTWGDEQCDDGNLVEGDGCSECKLDQGWECSNTSLIDLPSTSPDTCWELSNNTSPEESPEVDSSENITSNVTDSESQKQTSGQNESSWDDFSYLGTVTFFIVLVSSIAIAAANVLIGNDKIGIAVIPGILTPLWMIQIVFCFESGNKSYKIFFRSFGWAHLHFSQPIQVESRRLVDLLGTQITTEALFLENIQYWIFIFFLLVLVSGVCWLVLPKHSAFKIQKLMFLYYYLFSSVPLAYFSVYSFVNPDLSGISAVISFVLSIVTLVGYICVFAYLVFSLLCCSPEDSEISDCLTLGLKFQKQQASSSRTNDGKYEQSLPNVVERVSLEEESSGCQDEGSDRKLDKTRVKVQSAPISVFKYRSPEKSEVPFLYEIEFRFLNLVMLAGLTCASIALAAGREVKYLSCGLAASFLIVLLVIVALKPAYQYSCYKLSHIFCLLMLVIISGLLISQDEEVSSCFYYFVIFLVFAILCCYIHQLVWILLLWMNVPSSEVKDLIIKPQEPSISYVRDSIPEERAPNSATINNLSYEISMSVN